MQKVIIRSGSIVSPLGFTVEENVQAVLDGRSGVVAQNGTFGIPEPFMASLFDRDRVFERAAGQGITGYPLFETILLLSIRAAVAQAGIDPASPRTALVISSIKGNVEALGTDASSVPVSVSAERVASFLGCSNLPLVHARRMLLSGAYDRVIVAGAEVQSRFIVSGFQSLKALSPVRCKPFDADRSGLNLGEAAATVVLERTDTFDPEDWELVDGATRNDANHISGPSRTGEGSYNALRYVLASCSPDELAFINVHGTATLFNDEMESIALQRAGLSSVPVNALKAVFGHTMGAAGLLEVLVSMRAVDAGIVPATLGFTRLGVSCPVNVSAENRPTGKRAFIKLLSGFGGCNAAMLFRKGGTR